MNRNTEVRDNEILERCENTAAKLEFGPTRATACRESDPMRQTVCTVTRPFNGTKLKALAVVGTTANVQLKW